MNGGLSFSISNINFRDNALTQASVDLILSRVDDSGLDGTGASPSYTLDLGNYEGGSNAIPSSTASVSISNLLSKGWDVLVMD